MDVETKDFGRERVLGGKLFSPQDTLLPGSLGHWAIMGLQLAASNWGRLERSVVHPSWLTLAEPWTIVFWKFVPRLGF